MAEFMTKVANPVKMPSHEDLTLSIHGVRRRLKKEMDPEKRYRLMIIGQQLRLLRKQLA
jgi:hypothetical protein